MSNSWTSPSSIAGSRLSLLASVTDTELITVGDIEQYRLDQGAITKKGLDRYVRESTKVRRAPIKRAGPMSQISHGEFLQAQFLVHLIRAALQRRY